jgi:putative MATE family efflux protein
LRAFSLGGIFIVTTFVAGGVMRGSGDARTPMLVTLVTLIASLAVGYPLIFGQFGFPELGVIGAGLATAAARGIGCVVLLFFLFRPGGSICLRGWHDWRPALEPFRRLLNIGLPSMFESLFRAGGMLIFSVIVFRLGTTVAAAQQVAQQIAFFSMMPGFGFSMAAMTLVGQSLGANNPVRAGRASWFAMRSCLAWMGSMGLVFFFGGPWIMTLFTSDPEIVAQGAAALKVIAFSQPGQAFGMVLAGSLRGAGDTRYPMFTTAAAMWFVRLPVAWLLGITLGFGLVGVYAGWVIDTVVLSLLNWARYRTGKWQKRRVAVG